MSRDLNYYLKLNYPITVYRADEGGYVAEIEDLPGCITQGETLEEVMRNIEDARVAWLHAAYEGGIDIPVPRTEEEYSGKFVVRIPKYLHKCLAERARREGVSLNQYVATLLAAGLPYQDIADKVVTKIRSVLKGSAAFTEEVRGTPPAARAVWAYFSADWKAQLGEVREPRETMPVEHEVAV